MIQLKDSYDYVGSKHLSPFVRAQYDVFKVIAQEKEYLEKHPKQLAWVMYQFDILDKTSRWFDKDFDDVGNDHDTYWGNPKYPVTELTDSLGDEVFGNLVYDAWLEGSCGNNSILKVYTELECKENKTADDHVAIRTAPNYPYKSLHPTVKAIEDHLLCTIVGRENWNKKGFYNSDCSVSDGNSKTMFYNFQFSEELVPKRIKNALPHLKNKELQEKITKFHKLMLEHQNEKKDPYKMLTDNMVESITKNDSSLKRSDLEKLSVIELNNLQLEVTFDRAYELEEDEERKIWLLEKKKERLEERTDKKIKEDIARSKHQQISDNFTALTTMPPNVHESYIKMGLRVSARILTNPYETDNNINQANKFILKWGDRFPEYFDDIYNNPEKIWSEHPIVLKDIKSQGIKDDDAVIFLEGINS